MRTRRRSIDRRASAGGISPSTPAAIISACLPAAVEAGFSQTVCGGARVSGRPGQCRAAPAQRIVLVNQCYLFTAHRGSAQSFQCLPIPINGPMTHDQPVSTVTPTLCSGRATARVQNRLMSPAPRSCTRMDAAVCRNAIIIVCAQENTVACSVSAIHLLTNVLLIKLCTATK